RYTNEFGGEKLAHITQHQAGITDGGTSDSYDPRGNLQSQIVTDAGPGPSGFLPSRRDTFTYDNTGQIVVQFQQSGAGDQKGLRDYFYVAGQQVAVVGNGSLEAAQFNNNYTPISQSYPATTPAAYTVNSGDTLAGIARLVYGDPRLWYVIADANSLGFGPLDTLPTSEVGKTYRIPSVISAANNADTSTPYNPASIYGNNVPTPYIPGPGPTFCAQVGQVVATAVVVAVTLVVAYYTGPEATQVASSVLGDSALGSFLATGIGGGIAAAAGDAAGQATAVTLGVQKDFSGKELLQNLVTGAVTADLNALAPAENGIPLASALAGRWESQAVGQITSSLIGLGGNGNGGSVTVTEMILDGALTLSGLNKTLDSTNFKWSQAIAQFAAGALDPANGWAFHGDVHNWGRIASQAISPFENVALGGVLPQLASSARQGDQQPGDLPQPAKTNRALYAGDNAFQIEAEERAYELDGTPLSDYEKQLLDWKHKAEDWYREYQDWQAREVKKDTYLRQNDPGVPDYIQAAINNSDADYVRIQRSIANRQALDEGAARAGQTEVDNEGHVLGIYAHNGYLNLNSGNVIVVDPSVSHPPPPHIVYGIMMDQARRDGVPPQALISEYFRTPAELDQAEAVVRQNMQQDIVNRPGYSPTVTIDYQAQLDKINWERERQRRAESQIGSVLVGPGGFLGGLAGAAGRLVGGGDVTEGWILGTRLGAPLDGLAQAAAGMVSASAVGAPSVPDERQFVQGAPVDFEIVPVTGGANQGAAQLSGRDIGAAVEAVDINPEPADPRAGIKGAGVVKNRFGNLRVGEDLKYTFGNAVRQDNTVGFFGTTKASEVAAEAEAAILRGATEVNIGSGTHGVDDISASQFFDNEFNLTGKGSSGLFLEEDLATAAKLQQQYPGVTIKVYDALDPEEYAAFQRQVARAVPGSNVAAIAAWCHSVRNF
ncbi:MAG TPA: hypothetical protein VI653_02495, partial [Steroidobacteraceae bacterium]